MTVWRLNLDQKRALGNHARFFMGEHVASTLSEREITCKSQEAYGELSVILRHVFTVVLSYLFSAGVMAEVEISRAPEQPATLAALFVQIAEREARLGVRMSRLAAEAALLPETRTLAARHHEMYSSRLSSIAQLAVNVNAFISQESLAPGGIAPWLKEEAFDEAYQQRRLRAERYWVTLLRAGIQSDDKAVASWSRAHLAEAQKTLYDLQSLAD